MKAGPGEGNAGQERGARIRDYWLGGCHHTEQDRVFGDQVAVVAPQIPYLVRMQRALLRRMVCYLLDQGIRQFLDLGSGVPTREHVHEIVQDARPQARVVYVDNDPEVAADGQNLVAGLDNVAYLPTDLLEPCQVLGHPLTLKLLDLRQPVALLAIATMQQIPDADDPAGAVAGYLDALAPGSFLAMTHHGPDPVLDSAFQNFAQMNFGPRPQVYLRDRITLGTFFRGLDIVEPGIVPVPLWRPDPGDEDTMQHPERVAIYVAAGRKP